MNASSPTRNSSTFSERRIPRGKHTIYARDYAGVEPAFVLMHGFPDNLGIYDRLAPILADAGQRVIAFDFLGYGGSDKPGEYPYNAKNMVGDLEAVLAALELKTVIPVGHDASGPTAIEWSVDHPDRATDLVLLNTYYDATPALKFPEFIRLFADPTYGALSTAIISDPAQFGWLLMFQGRQFLRDLTPAQQEEMQKLLVRIRGQFATAPSAASAFVSLTRELHSSLKSNTQRAPKLSEFRRHVSLIWGAADPYLNSEVAKHLGSLFPNASLELLDLGHWPQIDGPDDVAKALLALT